MTYHQELMTAAYDRYQRDWSKAEFEAQLSAAERPAVLIGNFNYQVENGGFSQWLGNGYATRENVRLIRVYLSEIPGSEAHAVDVLLDQFWDFCEARGWDDARWSDNAWDALESLKLDDQYYAMNNTFMEKVNEWLVEKFGPKPITEETTARLATELRAMQTSVGLGDDIGYAVEHILKDASTLNRFANLLRSNATAGSALRELCGGNY